MTRAQKIMDRIDQLASITEAQGCITRTYGTPAFIEGRTLVQSWMDEAGLQTSVDAIGNVRGKWLSEHPTAKTLVIGSHIDSVINAGRFDGPLGVIMGIDLVENLIQQKIKLPFHVEVVGFCDEEGVRFGTTYLGSKVLAGSFDESLLLKEDSNGITLKNAIENCGGDISKIKQCAIPKEEWLGYFEMHIEQGPVLYDKNISTAIVSHIAGQYRASIEFTGIAGHAGTVPMNRRHDALACASEFVLAVEQLAQLNDQLVATVGKLEVIHAAGNVIPGKVICSLDMRSADIINLLVSVQILRNCAEQICSERRLSFAWNKILQTKPVACDAALSKILENAIAQTGSEVVSLVSGAGHDAVPISEVAPVSMLFIRCFEGISHHPLENAALKDIAAAVEVADHFLQQLISL